MVKTDPKIGLSKSLLKPLGEPRILGFLIFHGKKRLFGLAEDGKTLHYFGGSRYRLREKGVLHVSHQNEVGGFLATRKGQNLFQIEISDNRRPEEIYFLYSKDEEEWNRWIDALTKAICDLRAGKREEICARLNFDKKGVGSSSDSVRDLAVLFGSNFRTIPIADQRKRRPGRGALGPLGGPIPVAGEKRGRAAADYVRSGYVAGMAPDLWDVHSVSDGEEELGDMTGERMRIGDSSRITHRNEDESHSHAIALRSREMEDASIVRFNRSRFLTEMAGVHQSAALSDRGVLYVWGNDWNKEVGSSWKNHGVRELIAHRIVHASLGSYHCAAVAEDGSVFTWGDGSFAQLGHGGVESLSIPKRVDFFNRRSVKISFVSCGRTSTGALSSDGALFTFGWGWCLGLQLCFQALLPRRVEALRNVVVAKLSVGWQHALAASAEGVLYSWGNGKYGRLGHRNAVPRYVPTVVTALAMERVVCVCAGEEHSIAVTDSGLVYSWGRGQLGQLGRSAAAVDSSEERSMEKEISVGFFDPNPQVVDVLRSEHVVVASSKGNHVVVVTQEGRLLSWGSGSWGELGDGEFTSRAYPVAVLPPQSVPVGPGENVGAPGSVQKCLSVSVSARRHSIVVTDKSELVTWGYGHDGQLGFDVAATATPYRVRME